MINYFKSIKSPLSSFLEFILENHSKHLYIGKEVLCKIDVERRRQLMTHHTATHIVCAACKRILGPHVWQNGAKKTEEMAHLDITHYKSLTYEEERNIQM